MSGMGSIRMRPAQSCRMNGYRGENVELTTERLLLRPFLETDHEDLYEFLSRLEKDEFEGYPGITRESSLEAS